MHNEMQLMDLVKSLKLSGILETLESRLKQARDATMSYEELLTILLLCARYFRPLKKELRQAY